MKLEIEVSDPQFALGELVYWSERQGKYTITEHTLSLTVTITPHGVVRTHARWLYSGNDNDGLPIMDTVWESNLRRLSDIVHPSATIKLNPTTDDGGEV